MGEKIYFFSFFKLWNSLLQSGVKVEMQKKTKHPQSLQIGDKLKGEMVEVYKSVLCGEGKLEKICHCFNIIKL